MTYGPVDFIALKFKGNKFKGDALKALNDLMKKKIVRVIDMVIIVKDKDGKVTVKELQQPDPDFIAIFDPTKVKASHGMIKKDDIDMISSELENNSTAGLMLFENLWAIKFKEAIMEAKGEQLMFARIPHEVVLEALEDLEKAQITD
jgi:flagellar basal body rod protein FlgC